MAFYFEERQSFTQWWLWLIAGTTTLCIDGAFMYAIFQQLILGVPLGQKPLEDEGLLILGVVVITASTGMLLLFFNSVLEVRIDKRAIEYRYAPLIRSWRRIEATDIRSARARRYYLTGYGVKRDLEGTRLLTVKGTHGVELSLISGTRMMIGTQKPEQFLAAVEKMRKNNLS
jgi:hypothetical protein